MDKILELNDNQLSMALFGNFDEYAKLIEDEFNVKLVQTGKGIGIDGNGSNGAVKAMEVLERLAAIIDSGNPLTRQNVLYISSLVKEDSFENCDAFLNECICVTPKGRKISAKTHGQKKYIEAIRKNTIVFSIGPAGTGKTFIAVAMAVTAFRARQYDRIVLTRPAVEAGEKLGFLPGDLQNKVDPYLKPLYDSLFETMGAEAFNRYFERGSIEVAPLAYMRGRTLDNSFIILDEAQNTTPEQMKMFLTRLGTGSKAVVTGDVTQIDLPQDKKSGLKEVTSILGNIPGIEFIHLNEKDVVRHELVQKIIRAYEKHSHKGHA